MQAAEKILNGPGYFFCERFRAQIARKACIKRQSCDSGSGFDNYVPESFLGCKDCEQGAEIRRSSGIVMDGQGLEEDRRLMIGDGLRPRGASDPAGRLAIESNKQSTVRQAHGPGELRRAIINRKSKEETKMATKICKGPCGKELDLEKFVSNPGCKDGREGTCKECRAKRGKEMRDAKLVASGKTAKKLKRIKAVKQPPDAPAEVKASQEIESKIQVDLTTIIDLIAKAVEQRVMKRISERLS